MRLTLILAILLVSASVAAAQAPGDTPSFEPMPSSVAPPPETVSYRSDVLIADGVSLGLIVLGPALSRDAQLSAVGLAGYFLGAPLVHLARGRGGAAAKSLGLRAALPLLAGYAGYHLGPNDLVCASSEGGGSFGDCPRASLSGMLAGVIAGGAAAMIVDVKYLARYRRAAPTWTAGVLPSRGGVTVSVGGAF